MKAEDLLRKPETLDAAVFGFVCGMAKGAERWDVSMGLLGADALDNDFKVGHSLQRLRKTRAIRYDRKRTGWFKA